MNDSIVAIVGGLSGSDKHSNNCVSSYVIEQEGNALYKPMAYCVHCPNIHQVKILHIAIIW